MSKKLYLYARFERFWHWAQALFIFTLAFTGFEIHGCYSILGFQNATIVHEFVAYSLLILIAFAIFWHFTTGEWKQYIPKFEYLVPQIQYYLGGIFKGAPHPMHKDRDNKLNPLQALTYIALKLFIIPLMVLTGIAYLGFSWGLGDSWRLGIGWLHTIGAFIVVAFVIVHAYMTTTGETPMAGIKSMIWGYEEVPDDYDEGSH